MKIDANAGRSRKSLLDHCEHLKLTTSSPHEAVMLANLNRVFSFGGCITIELWDGTRHACSYRDPHREHRCLQCGKLDVHPSVQDGNVTAECPDCGWRLPVNEH